VDRTIEIDKKKIGANALEAITNGTTDGVKLAVNVGAMLLVFTALIAFANWILAAGIGSWTGLNDWITAATDGRYTEFSLQYVFGVVFAPLAWLMGLGYGNLTVAGQIIGEKTILNEFFAYGTLGQATASGLLPNVRDQIILTYALCGFSNIASIGIQIGGIGTLAPNQRSTLAQIGVKALLGGSIACFLTACVSSMLI
jgi:CNT family concentrative nucleoside transporter